MKKLAGIVAALCVVFVFLLAPSNAFDGTRFPGKGNRADYDKAAVFGRRATDLMDAGRFVEAIAEYEKTNKIYAFNPGVFFNMGNCYAELGQHAQAVKKYKEAIRLEPSYIKPYINLADEYIILKEFSSAEAACKQALQIDSGDPYALVTLGEAYLATNKTSQAKSCFLEASKSSAAPKSLRKIIDADLVKLKAIEARAK